MKTAKRILIVDDDVDVITVVKTILEKDGFEVISANDKVEGMKMLKKEKPDLVILDVMMSTHYEGFELAYEINSSADLKKIPFLMQTSIDVLTTTKVDVLDMAREYRKDPNFKDLQVLLVKNIADGTAAIDYRKEDGTSILFPVGGFVSKPANASKLLPEIKRLLNM